MIKLKKLLIQNFKGISSTLIVDLGAEEGGSVNILSGPNGFGKTTIFDAIELCLTGKFERIERFQDVQRNNANKNKPFYQHLNNQDVIIRLWIEKDGIAYVITKWYNSDEPIKKKLSGRENQPIDSHNFFHTFLSQSTKQFSSTDMQDFGDELETPTKYINELIYGEESDTELRSIYYLFNYLQQEDSIYFLRQKEDEKGRMMSFLFNIEEDERKKNELTEVSTHLYNEEIRIKQSIEKLKPLEGERVEEKYEKLFDEKDVAFDQEAPFQGVSNIDTVNERFRRWSEILDNLLEFRRAFSPTEYKKYIGNRQLQQVLLQSDESLKALMLKNLDSEKIIKELEKVNQKLDWAWQFEIRQEKNIIQDKVLEFFAENKESIGEYRRLIKALDQLNKELSSFDKIVSDLDAARQNCLTEFEKVKDHEHINDTKCPLCDSAFSSYEALIEQIKAKTATLIAFNKEKLEQKQELIKSIEVIANIITAQIESFRKDNKRIDQEVLDILRDLSNRKENIQKLLDQYPELNGEGNENLYFDSVPVNEDEINAKLEKLKEFLRESVLPRFSYDGSKIEKAEMYEEYFDNREEPFIQVTQEKIASKKNYLKNRFTDFNNASLNHLNSRLEKLRLIKIKTDEILNIVKATIKSFSMEMIDKIKVPFYIYSGKILQNYQQGMGIFIHIHPTGGSHYVQFKTGNRSDHDIVYHLSSGQLAVVAIAWCLSLNKVYSTNQHFKFLAIDDPIQTMDDLNVHMFIELLRYEFEEYQMLISTHDDFNSMYMKYKFDKFGMNATTQNVQKMVVEQLNA